jgi:hypothetical protein
MIKSVAARALLGVVALATAGGTTALAAGPDSSVAAQASPAKNHSAAARARAAGTIIKLSDKGMTVERVHRDKKTAAITKDDLTFELNSSTTIYRAGNRTHRLGLDALKVGQVVRVRFVPENGQKVARAVVVMPDRRAGHIISKDADGRSFTISTADAKTVHVTTSDKTRFLEGTRKNRKAVSYADLKIGDRTVVLGQEDSAHNFDATVVRSANADHGVHPGAPTGR